MHVRTLSSREFEGEALAMRIVISGGTVVTASGGVAADVLMDGERITGLAAPGTDDAKLELSFTNPVDDGLRVGDR